MNNSYHFKINDLSLNFKKGALNLTALDHLNFQINTQEVLGLVGESGSGKTTLGKTILNIYPHYQGQIIWNNQNIKDLKKKQLLEFKKQNQIIFQDPLTSINSQWPIKDILKEGLHNLTSYNNQKINDDIKSMIEQMGFQQSALDQYPSHFSGGQRQRICIARSLLLKPKLLICDEIVSALDISIKNQIINLLKKIYDKNEMSLLFISHDLYLTMMISDRMFIMLCGQILEKIPKHNLASKKFLHPYTQDLFQNSSFTITNQKHSRNISSLSPLKRPKGCIYHPLCKHKMKKCEHEPPIIKEIEPNHMVQCHLFFQ